MNEMNIVRLIVVGMSVLFILITVILVAAEAAGASRYSAYQGRIVDYTHRAAEDTCRPMVEFEANGEKVRCQASSIKYRVVKRLMEQDVTIYAYSKQGRAGTTWKCLVDTGSVFSRPGVMRVMPIAALFVAIPCFLLFVLKKLTSGQ